MATVSLSPAPPLLEAAPTVYADSLLFTWNLGHVGSHCIPLWFMRIPPSSHSLVLTIYVGNVIGWCLYFSFFWEQKSIKPSFVFCIPPHIISLHPILCMWTKGSDSIQTRLLLWRHQHHLPLCGERGHSWQHAHRWRYSHHWLNGKTVLTTCARHGLIKHLFILKKPDRHTFTSSTCVAQTCDFLACFVLPFPDCTWWMLPGTF